VGHIFISYSHNDANYAHRLADTLQAEGFDVWIDARIDYGSQWPLEIQKQLDSCDAFILIMSPRSFASEWVQSELQRAKRKLKPIIPLLLEGDEPWLSVESTQYYDVRGERSPDAKFYSALRRVAVPHEGQAVQLPANHVKKSSKPRPSAGRPKVKTETILAILGIVATLVAAVIPFILSNRSQNSTPPPANDAASTSAADHVTSTLPAVPSNGTPGPEATSALPAVISSNTPDISDASDFVDSQGVPMRPVAAGEFIMGDDNGDTDERPVHTVYLDAFYMDKYEVSNALYKACVDAQACQPPQANDSYTHPDYYDNPEFDNYPVLYVDWNMANAYCGWRGAQLPTEAQWEKAARGTDERSYPWGNEFNGSIVNFCDKNCSLDGANANYDDGYADTAPVDSYENGQSIYGIYNMAGNVWEWVLDWYSARYDPSLPGENPLGPASGQEGVLRGGAWDQVDYTVRVSYRIKSAHSDVYYTFGFRCALNANP